MKLLVFTLSVSFIVGEALKCHLCVPKTVDDNCTPSVETCASWKNACGSVVTTSDPYVQYQECMEMAHCQRLKSNTWMDVNCCTTDMCNTYGWMG